MCKFTNIAKKIMQDEDGAALVEYGLLVGLIAVVCVTAIKTLGETIKGYFDAINEVLDPA